MIIIMITNNIHSFCFVDDDKNKIMIVVMIAMIKRMMIILIMRMIKIPIIIIAMMMKLKTCKQGNIKISNISDITITILIVRLIRYMINIDKIQD